VTIDANEFWPDLRAALERAATMPADKASHMLAELMDDYRGVWPVVEKDIENEPELRALIDRALAMRAHNSEKRSALLTDNILNIPERLRSIAQQIEDWADKNTDPDVFDAGLMTPVEELRRLAAAVGADNVRVIRVASSSEIVIGPDGEPCIAVTVPNESLDDETGTVQ
jgi:hypothetical protein